MTGVVGSGLLVQLTRPVGTPVAILIAMAVGLSYALVVMGPDAILGTSLYWQLPDGLSGGTIDPKFTTSGYWWLAQSGWGWPLGRLERVGGGINAGLLDPVSVLAFVAKGAGWFMGRPPNLFPAWTSGAFVLNGAALATLVRGLGERSVLAAVLAGGLGAMAPVAHHRFGHFTLLAHWTFIFALALYAGQAARPRVGAWTVAGLLTLCALAMLSSVYLYPMAAAIGTAMFVQAAFDRRMSWADAALGVAAVLVAGVGPLWALGVLGASELGSSTIAFGQDSMNLMAPFWPQTSGAFAWTGLYLLTRGRSRRPAGNTRATAIWAWAAWCCWAWPSSASGGW